MHRLRLAPAALVAALLAASSAAADFKFSNANLFTVEYRGPRNAVKILTPADARAFELLPAPGGVTGLWKIPVLGTEAWVFITMTLADSVTLRWNIGVWHPGALPAGWRVEHLDQRFPLEQDVAGAAARDVFRVARVYGPTRYPASRAWAFACLYPNFLQTQMAALTNDADERATAVIVDDLEGHRKYIGLESRPSSRLRDVYVRHVPENLGPARAFVPRYGVLLRAGIADGLEGALAWYRSVQKGHAGSFLSRRQRQGLHPWLRNNKFILAPGAGGKTGNPVGDRYDMTDAYIQNVLKTFGSLHGRGLILYHMGWEYTVGKGKCVLPDVTQRIMPGSRKLMDAARRAGYRNIPYFLPLATHVRSAFYDPARVRIDRGGNPVMVRDPICNELFGLYCWHAPGITSLYNGLVVDTMMRRIGFDGVYLDALDASSFCFSANHDHPPGQNEQLLGANRWLNAARARARSFAPDAFLANESPTEVFPTDLSGLDLSGLDGQGLNLFRRTYAGSEWPTATLVLAFHPLLFNFQLARAFREGTRPILVWAEWDGVFPSSIVDAPEYRAFLDLLKQYSSRYRFGFDDVINGRLLARLASFQTTMVPHVSALDAYPTNWQRPVPAVLHGVFAPEAGSDRRRIVLARWTDPDASLLKGLNLPSSHPLRHGSETVVLRLSKKGLGVTASRRYWVRVYDAERGTTRPVGLLPASAASELIVRITMNPSSLQLVKVDPF